MPINTARMGWATISTEMSSTSIRDGDTRSVGVINLGDTVTLYGAYPLHVD